MEKSFEELDYAQTERGELILRRRKVPVLKDAVVYEVILNGEFLMSSLFHAAEDALAHLAIEAIPEHDGPLNIVCGGLGLGYTAAAALEQARVGRLLVIELFPEIIRWHRQGLVPLGDTLARNPKCRLLQGDFFKHVDTLGFGREDAETPQQTDAILLDIDHTPEHWLFPAHAAFYSSAGLRRLQTHLRPGGIFALWADGRPSPAFLERLQNVFARARAEEIAFPNPFTGEDASGTVYLAESPSMA